MNNTTELLNLLKVEEPKEYFVPIKKNFIKENIKLILRKTKIDLDFFYNNSFSIEQASRNKPYTFQMAKILKEELKPNSIIDFGCGSGDILKECKKLNINILGIDGSKYCVRNSLIKEIYKQDLRKSFNLNKTFDLGICLAVGEHIGEEYSEQLIENIIRHSDTILFASATEGTIGIEHINCQSVEYWINKFEHYNYIVNYPKTIRLRLLFSNIKGIEFYYINSLIYLEKKK